MLFRKILKSRPPVNFLRCDVGDIDCYHVPGDNNIVLFFWSRGVRPSSKKNVIAAACNSPQVCVCVALIINSLHVT